MDYYFQMIVYGFAFFAFAMIIHCGLNFFYPPACKNCKIAGNVQDLWGNVERSRPKARNLKTAHEDSEEEAIEEDL